MYEHYRIMPVHAADNRRGSSSRLLPRISQFMSSRHMHLEYYIDVTANAPFSLCHTFPIFFIEAKKISLTARFIMPNLVTILALQAHDHFCKETYTVVKQKQTKLASL